MALVPAVEQSAATRHRYVARARIGLAAVRLAGRLPAARLVDRTAATIDTATVRFDGPLPLPPWDTLWAITAADVAATCGVPRSDTYGDRLDLGDLTAVLDFVDLHCGPGSEAG